MTDLPAVSMTGDVDAQGDLLINAIPEWDGVTVTDADGNKKLTTGYVWVTPQQAAAAKAFGWAQAFVASSNGYVRIER